MSREVVIQIRIRVPDDVTPDVDYGEAQTKPVAAVLEAVEEPPPPEPPADIVGEAVRIFQQETPHCPVHRTAMVLQPAGIAKGGPRAGQPYPSFWKCTQRDGLKWCRETKNAA